MIGCTVNSETREAWNLSFYYVNCRYSAVITLCRSSEYCTDCELDADFRSAAIEHNTFCHMEVLSHVFSSRNCKRSIFCSVNIRIDSSQCRETRNEQLLNVDSNQFQHYVHILLTIQFLFESNISQTSNNCYHD